MVRKQADYLASLLADEPAALAGEDVPPSPASPRVRGGSTLLGRDTALARVASGEVRQVTQLLLDPARAGIWPDNARKYAHLTEDGCRELIDSIVWGAGKRCGRWCAGWTGPTMITKWSPTRAGIGR